MEQQSSTTGASPLIVATALAGVAAAVGSVVLYHNTILRAVLITLSVVLLVTAGNSWRSNKKRRTAK
ncbi:hypothetical protein [Streptomyces sp. NPDC057579]|uniref:hypothetical protein n=1 Tax=Streptomyces sp. NPDC057579 TaxID=3346172 RepID=UPI00367BE99F